MKRETDLKQHLEDFAKTHAIRGKGALCVMLVITRNVKDKTPPFSPEAFLSPKGGQVSGLGKTPVQAILKDYGIERTLAEEGGRTSRGSIENMRSYIGFLNELATEELLDLEYIEKWWIGRVKTFFASKPFRLKLDSSKSLRHIVGELLDAAFKRQRARQGAMVAGTVLQHLVGAKLEIATGKKLKRHGSSVADAPSKRKGDFLIGDTAIHVTTAPGDALIEKCVSNLEDNLRPLIITTRDGVGGAEALARAAGVADRLELLDAAQFIAGNILERSSFQGSERGVSVQELVKRYNDIVEECETDPSLKIDLG